MSDIETEMANETIRIGQGIPDSLPISEQLAEARGEIRAQEKFIERLLKIMVGIV